MRRKQQFFFNLVQAVVEFVQGQENAYEKKIRKMRIATKKEGKIGRYYGKVIKYSKIIGISAIIFTNAEKTNLIGKRRIEKMVKSRRILSR